MTQFIFFCLFAIAILAGGFVYFAPVDKPIDIDPLKFLMGKNDSTQVDTTSQKKTQEISITTSGAILKIRRLIDDLAVKQNHFLVTVQDQQQVLKNIGQETSDLMQEAQMKGDVKIQDILQLKALAVRMQDEQSLLAAHGQELIALNNQLMKNRQMILDQVNWVGINTKSSLNRLRQRKYSSKAIDLAQEAKTKGGAGSKGIEQRKALVMQMKNEQGLLMAHGQELLALNDQLTQNRQLIADQINSGDINTDSSLTSLQQCYNWLNDQADSLFSMAAQHNQEVRDLVDDMQNQLPSLAHNTPQMQNILDKEHEELVKLSDSEKSTRDFLMDVQRNQADSKGLLEDKQQSVQGMAGEGPSMSQDPEEVIQQRMVDQEQRMEDQMQATEQRQADSQEMLADRLQHTQDMIDIERQRFEDLQQMIQDRTADQEQRMQDQQKSDKGGP